LAKRPANWALNHPEFGDKITAMVLAEKIKKIHGISWGFSWGILRDNAGVAVDNHR